MRSIISLVTGILLTAAATCSFAQGQPSNATPKPAPVAPAAKHPARKHAAAKSADAAPAAPQEGVVTKPGRRDPFESLIGKQKAQQEAAKNLPPGKGGLQVSTLKIDGIVHAPNGMIAVVSNPQNRTYFLHEGDQLYDGKVERIAMDGVSFHESGKDAFGKPTEREVNKRIYSNAGEEQ
jgi:Tfp pilus assembly protein PilP